MVTKQELQEAYDAAKNKYDEAKQAVIDSKSVMAPNGTKKARRAAIDAEEEMKRAEEALLEFEEGSGEDGEGEEGQEQKVEPPVIMQRGVRVADAVIDRNVSYPIQQKGKLLKSESHGKILPGNVILQKGKIKTGSEEKIAEYKKQHPDANTQNKGKK